MKTERKSKNYDEYEVVKQLNMKSDLRIIGKQIQELREGKGNIGNGSRGKIDFLTKYCGYSHFYVKEFKR